MKKILFLVIPLLLFSSCRDERYVDTSKSMNYYYSTGNKKILYDANIHLLSIISSPNYKELTANADSFTVLAEHFGKDDEHVFYRSVALTDADHKTFCWDSALGLPKDKKHIYLPTAGVEELPIIEDADPATYEEVEEQASCTDWYRDKNYYFYNHEKTEADRATLNFENPHMPYDNTYIFYLEDGDLTSKEYVGKVVVVDAYLVHDDQEIFFQAGCDSINRQVAVKNMRTFKYHDPVNYIFEVDAVIFIRALKTLFHAATFKVVNFPYMKDKDHVYCNTEIIEHADPASIEVLDFPYIKDKTNVFYKTTKMPDVDLKSFEILGRGFAKDKNKVYQGARELSGYKPNEFVKDAWERYPSEPRYGKSPKTKSSRRWRDDD